MWSILRRKTTKNTQPAAGTNKWISLAQSGYIQLAQASHEKNYLQLNKKQIIELFLNLLFEWFSSVWDCWFLIVPPSRESFGLPDARAGLSGSGFQRWWAGSVFRCGHDAAVSWSSMKSCIELGENQYLPRKYAQVRKSWSEVGTYPLILRVLILIITGCAIICSLKWMHKIYWARNWWFLSQLFLALVATSSGSLLIQLSLLCENLARSKF